MEVASRNLQDEVLRTDMDYFQQGTVFFCFLKTSTTYSKRASFDLCSLRKQYVRTRESSKNLINEEPNSEYSSM